MAGSEEKECWLRVDLSGDGPKGICGINANVTGLPYIIRDCFCAHVFQLNRTDTMILIRGLVF